MTLEVIRDALACTVINWIALLWWLLFFIFAHDWMYRFHSKWFKISVEKFDYELFCTSTVTATKYVNFQYVS